MQLFQLFISVFLEFSIIVSLLSQPNQLIANDNCNEQNIQLCNQLQLSELQYNKGKELIKLKKYTEALDSLIKACEINKDIRIIESILSINDNYSLKFIQYLFHEYERYLVEQCFVDKTIWKCIDLQLSLGKYYYSYGLYGNALDHLNQLNATINSYESILSNEILYDLYFYMGLTYHKKGKLMEAFQNFGESLKYTNNTSLCRLNLGAIFHENGQYSEAIFNYEIALKEMKYWVVSYSELKSQLFLPDDQMAYLMLQSNLAIAYSQAGLIYKVTYINHLNFVLCYSLIYSLISNQKYF